MFINRKLFPTSEAREDVLPFSLVWDALQRHQGTKRSLGEIKMSLCVLRHYFLQKKLSRKLMIFQRPSHNLRLTVSEDASQCMGSDAWYRGRGVSASKNVLAAQVQHVMGFGQWKGCSSSICVWEYFGRLSHRMASSSMGPRQCKGLSSTNQFTSAHFWV